MSNVGRTAKLLAGEHVREDEGIRAIYWAPANDQVQLVEVTTS